MAPSLQRGLVGRRRVPALDLQLRRDVRVAGPQHAVAVVVVVPLLPPLAATWRWGTGISVGSDTVEKSASDVDPLCRFFKRCHC